MMTEFTYNTVEHITFSTYSAEETRKLSVLQITNIEILDALGHPAPGGLYDLHLGPSERDDFCDTCNLSFFQCPGHLGHIELPISVFSPAFFSHVYQLLRGSCFYCHRLLAPPVALHLILYQLQALDYGLVKTVFDLAEVVTDIENIALEDKFPEIQTKLQKTYKDAIKDLQPEISNLHVKSVVECRRNIIKSFIKNHMMGATGNCPHCKNPQRKINRNNMRLVYNTGKRPRIGETSTNDQDDCSTKELTAEEAKRHLKLLWQNERTFLQLFYRFLYKEDTNVKEEEENLPIDTFFMSAILVSPCKFRRLNVMRGRKYADVITLAYNEVLKDCHLMNKVLQYMKGIDLDSSDKDIISKVPGKSKVEKFNSVYFQLQQHVYEIFDSEINKSKGKATKGFKQIVEKKEGLFRMHMMGKRVNYAARSVISPDPYIMVNEIGVPMVFAKKLTFKEPVNEKNFERLQRAVMNGPDIYPGAALVETETGRIVRLSSDDPIKRQAIANTLLTPPAVKVIGGVKFVHRHLRNGDMLLLNRQPTLHKPSIMAHKARVLPGEKTLRLHYANCKSYNADFDGDEMNVHFPQSYLGQSEARHIVGVNHQYLVPKDGTPLSGLIQDHIIAGVLLTMRGRFFSKDSYHRLLYSAISFNRHRIKLLPPTILKPDVLWSGKQIVSSIIINLIPEGKLPPTLEGKSKVSSKNWKTAAAREWKAGGTPLQGDNMSESEVIIRHGELLCGVIDKSQVGPTPYSLVHICYELYGGETSSLLLTAFARLFTHFLQYYSGFTLGPADIVVVRKANKKRRRILRKARNNGNTACARALNFEDIENINQEELEFKYKEAHFSRDDFGLKMIDMEMKKVTNNLNNQINEVCIPSGLKIKFPKNNLQLMIESGAKGSSVNAMQISGLLGQIELEGRRMPLMLNGSTLPSFLPYSTFPGAGGFVAGRFLTGINPQEYFFHCMAGREGLIDTAVKTSRSGYLQRCLIKHLEGVTVNYDLTVRDSDGTVIQFLYGEDGLDPLKMQILKDNRLHLLLKNYDAVINKKEVELLKNRVEGNLDKEKKKILKWKKKQMTDSKHRLAKIQSMDVKDFKHPQERIDYLLRSIENLDDTFYKDYQQKIKKCIDPINSKYRPDLTFGAVTETLDSLISEYITNNPHSILNNNDPRSVSNEKFKDLCYYRAMRCLVEPGEAVGLLAAQSIGEPSTQMTLNTFHFAGKGEMNVTLGIPRLREILMTASPNIATPTMDLPFLDKPGIEKRAEKLKLKLSPVSLKEVLEYVKIKERISISQAMMSTRNYEIKFKFLDYSDYKGVANTTPSKNLHYIEHIFVKKLIEAIKRSMRLSASTSTVLLESMKESKDTKIKCEPKDDGDEESSPAPQVGSNFAENEGESSESEDEGDTTSAKSKTRHDQEQEYEDPEEDEVLPDLNNVENDNQDFKIKQEIIASDEHTTEEKYSETLYKEEKYQRNSAILEENKPNRINNVKCIHNFVSDYDFDVVSERWCKVTLQLGLEGSKLDMKMITEEEISKAYVHTVPNINEAILVKNPHVEDARPKFLLKTGGVNFLEIFNYVDILDINKVYSNNIHSIAEIYGIEAAASVIRKEIVNVFATYGITVDPRHLSLIADYMTCSGEYRPCNRIGMEGNASPLQQMTFETTTNFLVEAMLNGVEDRIKSPSSTVMLGQWCLAGTGAFGLKVKYNDVINK